MLIKRQILFLCIFFECFAAQAQRTEKLLFTPPQNVHHTLAYACELSAISDAMVEDGQWLIYGCEVAQGVEGRLFVEGLRLITGLQVAAATHKVGAEALGGSWVLDDAPLMVVRPLQVAAWGHVLAITSFSLVLGGTNTAQWNRPDPYIDSAGQPNTRPTAGAQESAQWGTFTSVVAGAPATLYNYAYVKFTPSQTGTFDFKVANTLIADSMVFVYETPTTAQSSNGDFLDSSGNPLGTLLIRPHKD